MSDLTELVDRYYTAFNNRDWDAYEQLFSADAASVAPGGEEAQGIQAIREWDQAWLSAFPNARLRSLHKAVAGDRLVMSESRFSGTHTGPLQTPAGAVAATGKPVDALYAAVFEVEAGKLKQQRIYYDRLELQTQLGLL